MLKSVSPPVGMSRGQRTIVLAALISTAAVLHLSLCTWVSSKEVPVRLYGWTTTSPRSLLFTGLAALGGDDSLFVLFVGVVLPVVLLTCALVLWFGWRSGTRGLTATRSQRATIAVSMLLLAVLVHFALCEWSLGGGPGFGRRLLAVQLTDDYQHYLGVFDRQGEHPMLAAPLGLVMPILLLLGAPFLWLGWRRREWVSTGRCRDCGYSLPNPVLGTTCPECGSVAPTER